MKAGDILKSDLPNRGRAIVFYIDTVTGYHTIVTDYGNISDLTESEVLSMYYLVHEWCEPNKWLKDKHRLIRRLLKRFRPE